MTCIELCLLSPILANITMIQETQVFSDEGLVLANHSADLFPLQIYTHRKEKEL